MNTKTTGRLTLHRLAIPSGFEEGLQLGKIQYYINGKLVTIVRDTLEPIEKYVERVTFIADRPTELELAERYSRIDVNKRWLGTEYPKGIEDTYQRLLSS